MAAGFPDGCVAVLLLAFLVEAVYLGDLPRLVVSTNENDALGVSAIDQRLHTLHPDGVAYFAFRHIRSVKVSRLKYPLSTKSPRNMNRVSALCEDVAVPPIPESCELVRDTIEESPSSSPSVALASSVEGERSFFLNLGFVISVGGSMSSDVMTVVAVLGAWTLVSPGMPPATRKSSSKS